jgi:hypothetical protein
MDEGNLRFILKLRVCAHYTLQIIIPGKPIKCLRGVMHRKILRESPEFSAAKMLR